MKNKPNKTTSVSAKSSLIKKWLPVLVFLSAFLIYAQTINYDYACDDHIYTTDNSLVQKGISSIGDLVSKSSLYGNDGSNSVYYRPVFLVSFALEKSIFGNSPSINHFFNVLLYAVLCLSLYYFLSKLFKDYPSYVSVIMTLLFIAHPVHTEVTANIKSRDELFCTFFAICSLSLVMDYVQKMKTRLLIYSILCFFFCLMSKENGLSCLALIPLVLYFFSERSPRQIALITVPFIAVTFISMFIRWCALDSIMFDKPLNIWQNSLVATTSLSDQTATAFTIQLHALKLLFLPVTLSWDYSYNHFPIVSWSNYAAILSLLIHLSLIGIAIAGIRKKNIFSFAIVFYFITSFLTSNLFIKIGTTFAERFLFMPSIAFCIVLPFMVSKIFKIDLKTQSYSGARKVLVPLSLLILLYSARTLARNADWRNNMMILESGIHTAPNSMWAHYTYAIELNKKFNSETDPAQRHELAQHILNEYQRSIDIYPRLEIAYYEQGAIYNAIGDTANALQMYQKSLSLKPEFLQALYNAGAIQFINKNYKAALIYFNKVKAIDTGYVNAYVGAGVCSRILNDKKSAINDFEKALSLHPGEINLLNNLSDLYASIGDTAKARFYNSQSANQ